MKLDNWRFRTYPVRFTIDGKQVYAGNTDKSLGYITISCNGVIGKRLRIELTGTHADHDGYEYEELDPAKQAAEISKRNNEGKGMLGIVEIEVYNSRGIGQ